MPVALYSSDGEKWDHSNNDLSSCKPQMCVACTRAKGASPLTAPSQMSFPSGHSYGEFATNRELTPKWTADGSSICFVANECSAPRKTSGQTNSGGPSVANDGGTGATWQLRLKGLECGQFAVWIVFSSTRKRKGATRLSW